MNRLRFELTTPPVCVTLKKLKMRHWNTWRIVIIATAVTVETNFTRTYRVIRQNVRPQQTVVHEKRRTAWTVVQFLESVFQTYLLPLDGTQFTAVVDGGHVLEKLAYGSYLNITFHALDTGVAFRRRTVGFVGACCCGWRWTLLVVCCRIRVRKNTNNNMTDYILLRNLNKGVWSEIILFCVIRPVIYKINLAIKIRNPRLLVSNKLKMPYYYCSVLFNPCEYCFAELIVHLFPSKHTTSYWHWYNIV